MNIKFMNCPKLTDLGSSSFPENFGDRAESCEICSLTKMAPRTVGEFAS